MSTGAARGIAIAVFVLGCAWIAPMVVLLIIEPPVPANLPFAILIAVIFVLPGAIAIWRASRFLRETRPRRRLRRGFTVLPPK